MADSKKIVLKLDPLDAVIVFGFLDMLRKDLEYARKYTDAIEHYKKELLVSMTKDELIKAESELSKYSIQNLSSLN